MISVRNLTKRYVNKAAVDNISFDVEDGDIVGLLGPNGAGKTTTMRILTCFMPATEGTATVAGHDVFNDSLSVRQKTGYLPENVPLYLDMRVKEYLYFRARLKKIPRRDRKQKMGECLELCGITDVQNQIIGTLSKGYKQRVGLADALIHDPEILILDEPTIGLDPNQIRQIRKVIKDLGKKHTILLSTHILPEVEMVCNKVIIINKGKIVAMDTPANLMNQLKSVRNVVLEVKGDGKKIEESLSRVEGISSVVWREKGEVNEFIVEAVEGKDLREDIFKCIVKDNYILREMKRKAITLEEIFHQITTTETEEIQKNA
ncbi:MAG: ATP-binding cassette domain-containing protein [Candidatus Scalindua sp. AMX11]|nr:MAG: ATP-binding cassette domain-containing protein [Candidatus Scalindua sp.]NOG82343.1 ATP-binding cassette domain-containing protein [Planctomycetota bacterium]RZV66910.1 MAG: ATP-binding cassette domain-containing protein [Candidatus Scalindua sp. SCAELEC01]TDE63260.1 MAG: ATP-binding cassette domain-containing protein [Candidatus Scalindua sp. AMX11]GJQ60548.1 MAG: ABC transporter ATP-binding protein [Candidatus Scalindua sp.]